MSDGSALLAADPTLTEIVRRLAKVFSPLRIYLFGSKARGDAKPDSDYDLLVVVPDDAADEQRDASRGYECLWRVGAAVDIVIWRDSRFRNRARVVTSLPATVLREGKLVYGT
jgi:predicted nucleotidyltransferase